MVNLLTIKNIFNKLYLDPFFYFFMLVSCLSASFQNFFFFLSIIVIHEMGHLLMGLILGWNVDKVCLYAYGGVTKFNEDINRHLLEELLILLFGPLFQIIYLIIGHFLFLNSTFDHYNIAILIFNLLPIYPLDGGRILNIVFNYFFSFQLSYYLSIIVSFIVSFLFIIVSFINNYTINIFLMFLIVLSKVIEELRKRKYYFNKFILERYLNNYNFKKRKCISSLKKMKRDYQHIIFNKKRYYTEKEYLNKIYKNYNE